MAFIIKICGLSEEEHLINALNHGADWVGLVFHPKSPRAVSLEKASQLATLFREYSAKHALLTKLVALVVDPPESELEALNRMVQPDLWQFHGQETPDFVRDMRQKFALPIIKALGIRNVDDLALCQRYQKEADFLLLDAKPPEGAAFPGGHGKVFDWDVLKALPPSLPFMVSGGLNAGNVVQVIAFAREYRLNLRGVDVSSGVEKAPGVKDNVAITAFITAARAAGVAFSSTHSCDGGDPQFITSNICSVLDKKQN